MVSVRPLLVRVAACALGTSAITSCGSATGDANTTSDGVATRTASDSTDTDATDTVGSDATPADGTSTDTTTIGEGEQRFPDVIDATAEPAGDSWTISATLSSPYDSPERYADAWRVVGPDGTVYGERVLEHDHANEQPFTRSESGITIPEDVETVTIEGRDIEFGYGGETFQLDLPR